MAKQARGDVGATLREARERRGLSLRQISNSTKIAMMTLEALERNDIARLPGGIFSRSFVRAYAVEVGLEPEVMIEQFMSQFPQDSVTAGHPIIPRRGSRGGRKRAANRVHAASGRDQHSDRGRCRYFGTAAGEPAASSRQPVRVASQQ
jgi:transcriptional regulator with XRE-family HTH domain